MAELPSLHRSVTRRRRRMDIAAAASFILGGALCALGAALAQLGGTSLTTVNLTYLVGGVFFSLAGYISVVIAGWSGRGRDWYSAVCSATTTRRTGPPGSPRGRPSCDAG